MSKIFDHLEELRDSLVALEEGTLSDKERETLQQRLNDSPELLDAFVAYMTLTAQLEWEQTLATESLSEETQASSLYVGSPRVSEEQAAPTSKYAKLVATAVIAAGLTACVMFVSMSFWNANERTRDGEQIADSPPGTATHEVTESHDAGVAFITHQVDSTWKGRRPLDVGKMLEPGLFQLESGLVQIEFYSGVSAILEGPAEVDIVSANRAICRFGKIRASVPPQAHGFTLLLPQVELVDLGTEFGVNVDRSGKTNVHVFDGKVELYKADSNRARQTRRELTTGSGMMIDADGSFHEMVDDANVFVSSARIMELADAAIQRRYEQWQVHSRQLQNDPRLLVHYPFEGRGPLERILGGTLKNEEKFSGAIVGCNWTSGRWPQKDALEFKRPGDRVRIDLPGEFDSMTLTAWVRVDGLDRAFSSLMLTDKYDLGEVHWQVNRLGQLVLGVHHANGQSKNYPSPPIFDLARLGQWIHVATVFDGAASEVRHYTDGELRSSAPIIVPTTVSIGTAEIGNWGQPQAGNKKPIRNFNGRIDEMAVFKAALGADDIRTLFEAGKP